MKLYDEAIIELKSALKIRPDFAWANFDLAKAYLLTSRNALAIEELTLTLKLNIDRDKLSSDTNPSADEYIQIIRSLESVIGALTQLGELFTKYNLFELSTAAFKRVIELEPQYDNGYYNLGALYWRRGFISDAKDSFRETLRINPNHELARQWLSRPSR